MIISEKQICRLIQIANDYMMYLSLERNNMFESVGQIMNLLTQIAHQQSKELKVIE